MKTIRNTTILLLFLAILGCSKDDNEPEIKETPKSDAKAMTSFSFTTTNNATLTTNITATINESSKTVATNVPSGTDITALTPSIAISEKASVSPTGAQDFSSPVTYTVTAEDGSKATYTVSLEIDMPIATVDSMSPLSGPKTTIVTFTGTNFGTDINAVQIFFDDIEAPVQSVTDTQIVTTVPPLAFAGVVRILINSTEFTGFTFEYEIVDIEVSTFAGSTPGFIDSSGINAQFFTPRGIASDNLGNFYIADVNNRRIRKITPDGEVSTFAGSGESGITNGTGSNATFLAPLDIAVDNFGNVYVADYALIRKITPEGIVSTLAGGNEIGSADGTGTNAQFNITYGVVVDANGMVYVADTGNHKIRKITPEGVVTTLAGSDAGFVDGNGTNAQFNNPYSIEIDVDGLIYVADASNRSIRRISTEGNVTTMVSADTNENMEPPSDIALDGLGNVYFTSFNHKILKINSNLEITTVAGIGENGLEDGSGANAQFSLPFGLVIDASNTIYIADSGNNKIRKITQE